MMKTALLAWVLCLITWFGRDVAFASTPERARPADVIQALYKAHQPWKHVELSWGDKRQLLKYFDASLTKLLTKDNECARRTKGVCRLEFDPVLGGQDFPDEGFKIEVSDVESKAGESFLDVTFKNIEVITLRFHLGKRGGQWRISDITYPDGTTLKTLLSSPTQTKK